MLSAFLMTNLAEIVCGGTFLGGFSIYTYFKLKGKMNKHKLVYYNVSDRVIKAKKISHTITDRAGGSGKNDTFFKASK
jgi:hypothetical protein